MTGTYLVTVVVQGSGATQVATHTITIEPWCIYLPLVLKEF